MQSQTRFIFRQGFIYGIGNIIVKLSGVILIPLYLRYIDESEYGVVTLFETIFQFILILSSFGVKGGFMRWYHDMIGHGEKKKLFFTTYFFNFATSLLTIIVVGFVIFHFSNEIFHYRLSSPTIVFFISAAFFRLMFELPHYLLKLEQKAVAQTWWVLLNVVLLIGTTFYFLEVKKMGLEGIYLGQLVAHSVTFLAFVPLIIRNFTPKFNLPILKEMLQYGLPLAVSNILTTVLTLSDRHIINQFQNLGEVAGYSMGYKVSNLVQMVIVASFITGYTNYYFKTMNEPDSRRFYEKIVRYFMVLISFGGLGIVLFSSEIIYVVSMGRDFFQSSVMIVPVLMVGMIFSGLRQIFTLPLNKHKRTRRISLILILSAVINLIGNFILVPTIGKMGASIATVLAQFFAVAWFFIELKNTEPVRFSLPANFALMMIWGVLAYTGMNIPHWSLLSILVLKGVLLLFFAGALFVTGHINREEFKELGRMYKKIRGQ